jgi:hypothetical protein
MPSFVSRVITVWFVLSIAALSQADWTKMQPFNHPSGRAYPAMAQLGSYVVLFGGEIDFQPFRDTWLWDGTNWTQITSFGPFGNGPTPPARYRAAMAFDPDLNEVVLFGGKGGVESNFADFDDTWVFRQNSFTVSRFSPPHVYYEWVQIFPPASSAAHPGVSLNAHMEYDQNTQRMILAGGETVGSQPSQETWAFTNNSSEGPKWTNLINNPSFTPARANTGLAKCGGFDSLPGQLPFRTPPDLLLMFGGDGPGFISLADTWLMGDTSSTAIAWHSIGGSHPSARDSHGMAYYPVANTVVMYGGQDQPSSGNLTMPTDTWTATCSAATSAAWAQASPAHNPGQRRGFGMATGPDGYTVVLFGGENAQSNEFSDTWTWGRRIACIPTGGTQISVGTEVSCQYAESDNAQFAGWSSEGFASPSSAERTARFHTESPGPASITGSWTDATGYHSATVNYEIVTPHQKP